MTDCSSPLQCFNSVNLLSGFFTLNVALKHFQPESAFSWNPVIFTVSFQLQPSVKNRRACLYKGWDVNQFRRGSFLNGFHVCPQIQVHFVYSREYMPNKFCPFFLVGVRQHYVNSKLKGSFSATQIHYAASTVSPLEHSNDHYVQPILFQWGKQLTFLAHSWHFFQLTFLLQKH